MKRPLSTNQVTNLTVSLKVKIKFLLISKLPTCIISSASSNAPVQGSVRHAATLVVVRELSENIKTYQSWEEKVIYHLVPKKLLTPVVGFFSNPYD